MKNRLTLWFIACMLVSIALYGNTLKGQFVYDDHFFVDRPELYTVSHLPAIWTEPMLPNAVVTGLFRPLSTTSFALTLIAFGDNPLPFRIINILLNGVNTFLVFLVVEKLTQNRRLAAVTSIMYAFLPIHTEAVAYIKARDELLAAFFVFLSWFFFLKGTQKKVLRYRHLVVSAGLFVLAMYSKELVMFSLAAICAIFYVKERPSLGTIVRIGCIYGIPFFLYFYHRYTVLGKFAFGVDDIDIAANPLKVEDFPVTTYTALKVLYTYVAKTFIPFTLSSTYHLNSFLPVKSLISSPQAMVGVIGIIAATVCIAYPKTRKTPLAWGSIFFLVSYFPFSQFVFNAGDIVGERWLYVSSFGLVLVASYLVTRLWQRYPRGAQLFFVALLFVYGGSIVSRNRIWTSSEALYQGMIHDAPNSIQGYYGMAIVEYEKGNIARAHQYISKALSIHPQHPPAINFLAGIEFSKGNIESAEYLYKRSLSIDPTLARTYLLLGGLYYATQRYDEALPLFEMNVRLSRKPRVYEVTFLAATLTKLGRYEESLKVMDRYITDDFDFQKARQIKAYNFYKLGYLKQVQEYFGNITQDELEALGSEF